MNLPDDVIAQQLEPTKVIEMTETSPGAFSEVIPETPSVGDLPHKLSVYFVLNRAKVTTQGDDSPDKIPVDNRPAFVEISVQFTAEKPGEIHDILRDCVGVVVQTKHSDGKTQVTPFVVSRSSAEEVG